MRKLSRYYLILLGVIVFALLVLQTPLMSAVRARAWGAWVGGIGKIFRVGPIAVPNNVTEQITRLTAENIRLKAENRYCHRIGEQIDSPSFDDFVEVKAKLMAQPIDAWRSQYIVNRGAKDGLVLGSPAIISDAILVGTVVKLNDHTAVMQELLHPQSSLPAEVLADEKTGRGLVQGKTFTAVEMVTIPRDVKVNVGQKIVTVAQSNIMPYGLLIGTVKDKQDEEYEPYQRVRLTLPYDPDELSAVTFLVSP